MKYILIHPDDNVAVALQPLPKGEGITCGGHEIRILEDIPAGHKVAVKTIRQGENVIKYGFPIGHVTQEAMPGQWINEHVLKTNLQGITGCAKCPVLYPFARYEYYNPQEEVIVRQGPDLREQTSMWTAGLNWKALPGLIFKADYTTRKIGGGKFNSENEFAIGVAYVGWFWSK